MPIITDRYIAISKDQLAQVFAEWRRRQIVNPAGYENRSLPEEQGAAIVEYLLELIVELFPSPDPEAVYELTGVKPFDPSIFTGSGGTTMRSDLVNLQAYNSTESFGHSRFGTRFGTYPPPAPPAPYQQPDEPFYNAHPAVKRLWRYIKECMREW